MNEYDHSSTRPIQPSCGIIEHVQTMGVLTDFREGEGPQFDCIFLCVYHADICEPISLVVFLMEVCYLH